jgi:subtilisin family serine protease
VKAAHPNFLRVLQRPGPSSSGSTKQWALVNDGRPGCIGADVHALAAWTITKGSKEIRVAVLDEGVDTGHPYLRGAVVAERDFVDGNDLARPNGNDAHGTACAGIILSQSKKLLGLAPDVRLVAARIAKSDDRGFWVFDDFATADAIEWCWADAKADVLSNSWGGGPASDVITEAINEARERGRGGKGAVVVFAAGNSQAPVDFPGNLSGVLTVGASNQWDERKTTTSKDGETWWGSNYGNALDLLAPGVRIKTTDIRGARGYDKTLVTERFNGTSSATPHVAATAALMLAVKPALKEDQVREIIRTTADPLTRSGKPNRLVGHGRLNAYAALWAARRNCD